METQSKVLTAEVTYEGQTFSAPYFVENGIIQANIDGDIILAPLTETPAKETVEALLLKRIRPEGLTAI